MEAGSVEEGRGLGSLCDWYGRNAGIVGALFAIVPSLIWYGAGIATGRFREVYLLRLALTLAIGGALGAYISRYGVSLWLIKHRSTKGPAAIRDGLVIGIGVGLGCGMFPPLTSLIQSSDPEFARSVIINSWLASAAVGAVLGAALGAIAQHHVDREWKVEEGQAP